MAEGHGQWVCTGDAGGFLPPSQSRGSATTRPRCGASGWGQGRARQLSARATSARFSAGGDLQPQPGAHPGGAEGRQRGQDKGKRAQSGCSGARQALTASSPHVQGEPGLGSAALRAGAAAPATGAEPHGRCPHARRGDPRRRKKRQQRTAPCGTGTARLPRTPPPTLHPPPPPRARRQRPRTEPAAVSHRRVLTDTAARGRRAARRSANVTGRGIRGSDAPSRAGGPPHPAAGHGARTATRTKPRRPPPPAPLGRAARTPPRGARSPRAAAPAPRYRMAALQAGGMGAARPPAAAPPEEPGSAGP